MFLSGYPSIFPVNSQETPRVFGLPLHEKQSHFLIWRVIHAVDVTCDEGGFEVCWETYLIEPGVVEASDD